jgi:hypothetical protein
MNFEEAYAVLAGRASAPKSDGPAGLRCDECADADGALPLPEKRAPPAELAPLSTGALLRLFLRRQEDRVAVYRRFERGFAQFLAFSSEAQGYRTLVATATDDFAELSTAVSGIEAELRARGGAAAPMAAALRTVQGHEKAKLELTARLQILRHGLAVDALHAEDAEGPEARAAARTSVLRREEREELTVRLAETTDELNEAIDEVREFLADEADAEAE